MRALGKYLIAKPRNAGIIAFLCTLLPLIYLPGDFISGMIVALVTLSRGAKAGLIVLAWVAIPALSLLYLRHFGEYDIVFLRALATWALAFFLLYQRSWRLLFEVLAVMGVLLVVAAHTFIPNLQGFWVSHLHQLMTQMNTTYNLKISAAELQEIVQRLAVLATGSLLLAFFLATVLQVALGRFWQLSLDARHSLTEEFGQIYFGPKAALILIAAFVGVLLKSPLIIDIFPMILLPFLADGLAVMHLYAKKNRGLSILLVLLYASFFLLPILSVIVLAGLGFVDSWVNFRGIKTA